MYGREVAGAQMSKVTPRRARNPVATREAILVAARTLIARDGLEAVSVSAVAQLAGVNRGTAYQRFATREKLVEATLESVSAMLFEATFGDPETAATRDVTGIDILSLTTKLADFAIENPELCRIWFLCLLASEHPDQDPFIHQYLEGFRRFAGTPLARPNVDSEIVTLMMLAANFLWPVWAKAHEKDEAARRDLAQRFVDEVLRLSMFGTMRPEHYPDLVEELARHHGDLPRRAVAGGR